MFTIFFNEIGAYRIAILQEGQKMNIVYPLENVNLGFRGIL
jgi:hypothetical protein